jgi:hypothetical protein
MTEPSDLPSGENPDGAAQVAGGEGFTAALGASLTQMLQFLDRANAPAARQEWYADAVSDPQYPMDLRRAFNSYRRDEVFEPGQLVQWKPMMRNRPYPSEGAPAVVIRYLDPAPRPDSHDLSEEHDIEVGFLDGEQSFLIFPTASARLTRWTE